MGRLGAFIAHIFGHIRHAVQQSIQSQTDLNHFRACVVGGMLFRFPPDGSSFSRVDGRPFLRQEVHGRACTEKYRLRLRRIASISSGSLRPLRETRSATAA